MKISFKYVFIFGFLSSLFSCTHQVKLEKGEYLLYNQTFKGNREISTPELELLIPATQKPNSRPFNLPIMPYVGLYNFGKSIYAEKRKDKRFDKLTKELEDLPSDSTFYEAKITAKKVRIKEKLANLNETRSAKVSWFWRNVGEKPAKINDLEIQKTATNINNYLFRRGYRDAKVGYKVDTLLNERIRLSYLIDEKAVYKIDSVVYVLNDDKIRDIFQKNHESALVNSGNNYDYDKILSERIRLETLLKNNGYFLFDKEFIKIRNQATKENFQKTKHADLHYSLEGDSTKPQLKPYSIESIEFTAIDASSDTKISEIDTSVRYFNGIKYIFIEKQFPVRLLDSKLLMRPNTLYRQNEVLETQRQLSSLDQFSFANPQFRIVAGNKLRAVITAPTLEKYFVTYELTGNTVQDIVGGGLSSTLRIRNIFHSLESLEIGGRFSLQGVPDAVNLANQRSVELGANIALNFPEILLPLGFAKKLALKRPRTQLSLSVNNSRQDYYQNLNFRFTGNYTWHKSNTETFQVSPIDMNLINTPFKSDAFKDFLAEEPSLKVLYDPQFVSSFNGSYLFDNRIIGQNTKARFLRIFVESGGTLMNLFPQKDKIVFIDNLIPLGTDTGDSIRNYFRFWKISLDYRRYFPISAFSSWAYRGNLGISQSYGVNHTMPYQKSFFVGGSNSLRAWSPRSLGPGSGQPDLFASSRYLPEPGDIVMEGSVEYRRKLFRLFVGDLNLGVFLDAGNVWKWYQDPKKIDHANFTFNRFYKEIAVGTGFGFRWDFNYFIIRYDLGIKVLDPSQPLGSRFVLTKFYTTDYYKFQSNFAIGMPF